MNGDGSGPDNLFIPDDDRIASPTRESSPGNPNWRASEAVGTLWSCTEKSPIRALTVGDVTADVASETPLTTSGVPQGKADQHYMLLTLLQASQSILGRVKGVSEE
ncbi:unnamed protein product [Natator depressus]